MASEAWTPLRVGPSLADQAYSVLRALITSGELAPAERVTERGLAGRLGVSPTPVREAISRLIHERLLVRVDGRTLQIADPSVQRLREMSMIQAALRGVAARLAAEHASDSELDEIERVHQGSLRRSSAGTRPNPADLRHEFHELIVKASHNPSLVDMVATAEAFGRALRLRAQKEAGAAASIRQAMDEHAAILEALRARDGDRAEVIMRAHERAVADRYLSFAESNQATSATDPTAHE